MRSVFGPAGYVSAAFSARRFDSKRVRSLVALALSVALLMPANTAGAQQDAERPNGSTSIDGEHENVPLPALGFAQALGEGAILQKTLVFGNDDNGFEADNVVEGLTSLGYTATRSQTLPADIDEYSIIWWVTAYSGISTADEDRLIDFVASGGSLYLTGERPCCEQLNDSSERIINNSLEDGRAVALGDSGDVPGTFFFNPSAIEDIGSAPNLLVDFIPDAPGLLQGFASVSDINVFASSEVVVVGAAWSENELKNGVGRIALLMDIDWLGNADRLEVIHNIQNFLTDGGGCEDTRHWDGFLWFGPTPVLSPTNCSTLPVGGTVQWGAGSDDGPVDISVAGSGVDVICFEVSRDASQTTVECTIGQPEFEGNVASVRVVAQDARGASERNYRVVARNNSVNVPIPFDPATSSWWEYPDEDQDGIPTHWEENGVWVDGDFLDLAAMGANPMRKDLFVYADYEEGEQFADGVVDRLVSAFAQAPLSNPDGSTGVTLHYEHGIEIPESVIGETFCTCPLGYERASIFSRFATSARAGGAGVPQLFKYLLNVDSLPKNNKGHHVIGRALGIPGNFMTTGLNSRNESDLRIMFEQFDLWPFGAADHIRAANVMHEFGHLLGLRHHGTEDHPDDDPAYRSVMSYAYNTSLLDYSDSTAVNHDWKMGEPDGSLTFVLGQWGEDPDFYSEGGNNALRFGPPATEVEEPGIVEVMIAADAGALGDFATEFGLVLKPRPQPFADVDPEAYYADAVGWAQLFGITTGTSATTFSPNQVVTRAQMATFLHRFAGTPEPTTNHGFSDVPAGSYFDEAVSWLKESGITTGTSDTTFSPSDPVTRAQMAAFLWRMNDQPTDPQFAHSFSDVASGVYFDEAVGWMSFTGITTGTSETTYSPASQLSRAQAVTFLLRLYILE